MPLQINNSSSLTPNIPIAGVSTPTSDKKDTKPDKKNDKKDTKKASSGDDQPSQDRADTPVRRTEGGKYGIDDAEHAANTEGLF